MVVVALALFPKEMPAQSAVSKEYQIKAVFLFNFAQFVEWPSSAFANANAPFRIGVFGDDPFGGVLDETVRNESINNHKLVVQRVNTEDDLAGCQLVFISKSEKSRADKVLSGLSAKPVLTVGESDGFARQGGVINFYLENRKVRFEINPSMAQHQGLKVSSQLLSLGKIVKGEPGKEEK